jgi:autotransporter-associated beta strand protein
VISSAHAQLYWDGNDGAAGFGTATGTWAAPTAGTTTSGWSASATGVTAIDGNSVTTLTTDLTNFGNGITGLGAGTITVDGTVASGNMTFASGSGAIELSGGTINLAAATSITVNNTTNTISSAITGAGISLTKAGTGTLILSGTSTTRTGGTFITGGRLTVAGTSATTSMLGTGAISWITSNTSLQIQSDSNLTLANAWTTSGRNLARTLVVDRLTSGDASAQIYTLSSQFLIDTNSNLTFSTGSNITSGTPTVNFSGGIRSSDSNTTPAITLTPNGVNVRSNGFSNTRGRIIILAGNSVGNEIYGTITQNAAHTANIVKSSTSTWTLSGANAYVGTTTVNAGTLKFAKQTSLYNNAAASWTAGNLNVKSGGILAFNVGGTGEFTTVNVTTLLTNLANSSSATNGMNAGSILGFDTTNSTGGTFTIADVIADTTGTSGGARGLIKLGTGTLELTNTNSYTGTTSVNVGKLFINGNQSTATGAVNVAALATLGGTGTVGGNVSIANTGNLEFSISTAPGSHDGLVLDAGKTLGFVSTSALNINSVSGGTTGNYVLITAPGGITGAVPAIINLPSGWAATVTKESGDTQLVLNVTSTGSGDATPPTLTSIADDVSGGPVNIGATVTYTVTFNEDIDAASVTAVDFDNDGSAAITVGAINEGSPGVFTVAVTATSPGSLKLRIPIGAVIEDVALNDLVVPVTDDTTITVRNAYQTWAITNAISSAPGQDKDGDGVNNAIEFVLGGDVGTNDLSKLPEVTMTATDMIVTFERKRSSIDGITGLEIEVGTTLTDWLTSYTVGTTTANSDAGVVVTENSPAGFDTITLTVPKGSDPKKFARLSATVTE